VTHFFGLDIKSLLNIKIVTATFGIGGAIGLIAPPWLRAWSEVSLFQKRTKWFWSWV